MKKKALFSSILSIVLCLTMISGATFALFTDSETVNIAVTAGTVDIDVTVENIMTKSYEEADFAANTDFTNGGEVTFADDTNQLTIDRITPGDAVKFDLVVTNKSNVDIQFFTKLGLVDGVELFKGMEYTITDKKSNTTITAEKFDGITRISHWVELEGITDGSTAEIARIEVIVELPYLTSAEDPTNEQSKLMGLSTTMFYTVQAVQGNADDADMEAIVNGATHIYTATDLQIFAANVNNGNSYKGETVVLMDDIDLENMAWTPIGDSRATAFKGHFDGQDYTVSNLNVDVEEYAGLFGCCWQDGVVIENLNVKNATLKSNHFAGVITAYMYGSILNCSVEGATISVTPNWNESEGSYDNGDKAGALVGWFSGYKPDTGVVSGNTVTDVSITAYRDAGGLIGHLADERNDKVPDSVTGNTLTNVTVTLNPTHAYTGNASTNAGEIVGRFAKPANHVGLNSDTTLNTMTNVKVNKIEIDLIVTNDAELAAALNKINTDSQYWNTTEPVVVKLVANDYKADHTFNQYPGWNGVAGAGTTANNYAAGVPAAEARTNVLFLGETGVNFTGNFTINGFGNSNAGFGSATSAAVFQHVTFDAANSPESNGEDYLVLKMTAAANNISFENCVFQNATHVTIGSSNPNGVGTITFDTCVFNNGGCISGSAADLTVKNTIVNKAVNGFISNAKSGTTFVENCTVDCGRYAFRTSNDGVNFVVTNSKINVYADDGLFQTSANAEDTAALVIFRDRTAHTAKFTNCVLTYGDLQLNQKNGNGTVTIGYTDENGNALTEVSEGFYKNEAGTAYYIYSATGFENFYNWLTDPTDANKNKRDVMWGKTYNLMADVDVSGMTWQTIRLSPDSNTAKGFTFNGNGHTISNLTITPTTSGTQSAGLFTGATKGTNSDVVTSFNNVTFDNVTVAGIVHHNGVVWGEATGSLTLNKVSVINSKISGGCNVGGLIGRNSECHATFTFVDCSVKNSTIEATKKADNAGASAFLGMALHIGTSCSANVVFEGTNVAEGNTLTSATGMQGGGFYTCATWGDSTWDAPVVVTDPTNYNSNN